MNIPISAVAWASLQPPTPKKRGSRNEKLSSLEINDLIQFISANPNNCRLTYKDLALE